MALDHVVPHHLRQDANTPDKEYIFDAEDEQRWHKILAQWCEQPQLDHIWQDAQHDASEQRHRLYARQHYITHLYDAGNWRHLFTVLDESTYGKAKVLFDVSTRTYALDLELGQKATTLATWNKEEAIGHLPRFWRYTLLRCSLASKADRYSKSAFQLMLLLGQGTKARDLAELLTDPLYKTEIFLLLTMHFVTLPTREGEYQRLFIRTQEIALTIQDSDQQAEALSGLGQALAQAQRWQQAEQVIQSIQDSHQQALALSQLGQALAQAQRWQQAEEVIQPTGRATRLCAASAAESERIGRYQGCWKTLCTPDLSLPSGLNSERKGGV